MRCKQSAHKNSFECHKYQALTMLANDVKLADEIRFLQMLEETHCSSCPKCAQAVDKIQGCNHMKHVRCPQNNYKTVHFCYICRVELHPEYSVFELLLDKNEAKNQDINGEKVGPLHYTTSIFER